MTMMIMLITMMIMIMMMTLLMTIIGTLRNCDVDSKENVKKAIGLMVKTTTLHEHHALLYISLLSLLNCDVK